MQEVQDNFNQMILTGISSYNLSEQIRSGILALEGKWNRKHIDFNLILDESMIAADQEKKKQLIIMIENQGNGVGLALVKKAVELHHGQVRVETEAGRVKFCVILPKVQS